MGAFVVYDLTKRSSFENVSQWQKELKSNADPDIALMLVGNKVDLCLQDASLRKVSREEGEKLAIAHNILFEEMSAVENINVKDSFEALMQRNFEHFEII